MSEVEMLGLAGAGIIALFLVIRAVLGKGRGSEDSEMTAAEADGGGE